jgi:uncharacterized protein (DUF58 family)
LIPSRRLALIGFLIALFACVAVVNKELVFLVNLVDGLLIAIIALELLLIRGTRFEATREAPDIFSVGRTHMVALTVRNRSARRIQATISDDPVADCMREGLPQTVSFGPHSQAIVKYEVTAEKRGRKQFGAVVIRYPSPLGLLWRQERIALVHHVDVYPDVHAARALELMRRQGRGDARMGSLLVRGGETEFERLRAYEIGDEPRRIDWRATARRGDVTVRQYQTESNQNIIFALDVGRGMLGESEGLSYVDRALNASLLAADVALRTGDRAGLFVFDDAPKRYLAPVGGKSGGQRLIRAVYELNANLAATDYRGSLAFLRAQTSARSLVIIFTQLLDARSGNDLSASARALMPRHVPLVVLMRDVDVERAATAPIEGEIDVYERAAAGEALAWRDALISRLRRDGVFVIDTRPDDLTPDLVKQYLEIKTRRLL